MVRESRTAHSSRLERRTQAPVFPGGLDLGPHLEVGTVSGVAGKPSNL